MTLLIVFTSIVFTIFCISIGYKLAMIRWCPKDLTERLDKFVILNKEINDTNNSLIDINKSLVDSSKLASTWYMTQLNNIGLYLKEKYKDNYVFDQLKSIPGYIQPPDENKEYDVDDILDKVSKHGWESLTEGEKNYLKKPKE